MRGNKEVIYWDTSIFLAWLQDEKRKAGEMDGVREFVRKAQVGEIILVTSEITRVEILESKMTVEAKENLSKLFKRRNVQTINLDPRISNLASEIRDYYERQKQIDGKPGLSVPDAIHLATAIQYEVNEFHTFDEKDSPRSRALLPLNGNVAGHNLVICKPHATQLWLDLQPP